LSGKIKPTKMVILVQKEIADRIMAKSGKESLLSISVKAYGEPRIITKVSKGSFVPIPKVDSAVILIDNISSRRFTDVRINEERFFDILKIGFAHKRKVLISNLRDYFEKNGKNISEVFSNLNLFQKVRAEDLKLEDWGRLSLSLQR